ncbi:MAG TPA: rhomboid family intramembrane serine protease [Myxococcales bacterium]|jgi:membrane associated rhomboid family serine protease
MFFMLPVGVEGATASRMPYVSIGLAATCLIAFLLTWVLPEDPEGAGQAELVEVVDYWHEHPYLEVPTPFVRQFLNPRLPAAIAATREQVAAPSEPDRALEQAELDGRLQRAAAAMNSNSLRRWMLVPGRGGLQWGWLTHLFLHLGWMHLLGNLLFFYLTGPLLEDAWGRLRFLGFYLAGGLVASAVQVTFDRDSAILGASGAIAACIGAFTLRYAHGKVRIGYFFLVFVRVFRGTFLIPAWLWGLFWFGSELFDFWTEGGTSGVAVMAHLGGFAFGFAVAVGMRAMGWGLPAPDAATVAEEAEDRHRQALEKSPSDVEALLALAQLELEAGKKDSGMSRAERAVRLLLAKGRGEERRLFQALSGLGTHFDCAALQPQVAVNLSAALERAPAQLSYLVEPALQRAGDAIGDSGVQALLKLSERRLGRGEDKGALALLTRARAVPGLAPARIAAVEALLTRARGPEASEASAAAAAAPRFLACKLLGVSADALALEASGRKANVPIERVRAIRAALVLDAAGARNLVTDLVVPGAPGQGPTVARFGSAGLQLGVLFPGAAPREAYPRLLTHLARRSGAILTPPLESIASGALPTYPSQAAMDAALYGVEEKLELA